MSLTPAMIDALVASGATVEMLAAVMKAALIEDAARASEKRAKDADRQRRHRDRHAVSRGVTVTNGDSRDTAEPFPLVPPKEISNPPLIPQPPHIPGANAADADADAGEGAAPAGGSEAGELPPARPRLGQGKGGYHPLPLGWVPVRDLSPSLVEAKAQWPPGWMAGELEAFRNWAVNAAGANGKGLKKDWDAAWQNWLRDRWNDQRRRIGTGTGNGGGRRPDDGGYRNPLARAAAEDVALGLV